MPDPTIDIPATGGATASASDAARIAAHAAAAAEAPPPAPVSPPAARGGHHPTTHRTPDGRTLERDRFGKWWSDGRRVPSPYGPRNRGRTTPGAGAPPTPHRPAIERNGPATAPTGGDAASPLPPGADRRRGRPSARELELDAENARLRADVAALQASQSDRLIQDVAIALSATFQLAGEAGAKYRGPHWRMDEAECDTLGEVWARVWAYYAPPEHKQAGVVTAALLATVPVLVPRIREDIRQTRARARGALVSSTPTGEDGADAQAAPGA